MAYFTVPEIGMQHVNQKSTLKRVLTFHSMIRILQALVKQLDKHGETVEQFEAESHNKSTS